MVISSIDRDDAIRLENLLADAEEEDQVQYHDWKEKKTNFSTLAPDNDMSINKSYGLTGSPGTPGGVFCCCP